MPPRTSSASSQTCLAVLLSSSKKEPIPTYWLPLPGVSRAVFTGFLLLDGLPADCDRGLFVSIAGSAGVQRDSISSLFLLGMTLDGLRLAKDADWYREGCEREEEDACCGVDEDCD